MGGRLENGRCKNFKMMTFLQAWNYEFDEFLTDMGCYYYYGIDICDTPLEEDNYETFLRMASTRYNFF